MSNTASAGPQPNSEYQVFGWQIAVLLLIAFALRLEFVFQHITDGFSWREASTAMMADNLPKNGWNPLWPQVSWTGDLPGYQGREFQFLTIFAALLNEVFGWSDWSGRLVAAIFGTLTTYSLFRLISILFGRTQGLVSALFYAVLPGAIIIDSAYLPDPAMVGMEVTALWCLAEAVSPRAKRQRLWCVLAAVTGTIALLAKLPAATALVPACYLVWSSARDENRRRSLIMLVVGLAWMSIPVIAYYRWAIYIGTHYPPFHIAGFGWLWDVGLCHYWERGFYLDSLYEQITTWLWGPVAIVLATIALVSRYGTSPGDRRDAIGPWFLEFWLLGCAIFYFVAAGELEDNIWNYHVFNPMIAALAARACLIMMPSGPTAAAKARIAALAVLTLLLGREAVVEKKAENRHNDYLLGEHLRILSQPGDLVIASGSETGSPLAIYYTRRKGWLFPSLEMGDDHALFTEDGEKAIAGLRDMVAKGARWFGVAKDGRDQHYPPKYFADHYKLLLEYLSTHAKLAGETETHIIYDLAPLRP